MTPPAPLFDVAAFTHRGAVRAHNEDTVFIAGTVLTGDLAAPFIARPGAGRHLFAVADGMGGHAHGELASRTAIEVLGAALGAAAAGPSDEAGCRDALLRVNAEIFDLMARRPETIAMGTTVVGAVVEATGLIHFNVGDSRAYRHGPGGLAQLGCDDALGAGAGRRTSHVLTQCLGGASEPVAIAPHVGSQPALGAGETLVLCSDGLTDMVDDDEIARILDAQPDAGRAAASLFGLAMDKGGLDNVSLVIVRAANPGAARGIV